MAAFFAPITGAHAGRCNTWKELPESQAEPPCFIDIGQFSTQWRADNEV